MRPLLRILASLVLGLGSARSEDAWPDIRSVPADLAVPEMGADQPAAGRRVKQTVPGWEGTEVYHALYLPTNWKPAGRRWPVIVEWPGNGGYRDPKGDECNGRPEGCKLGYGVTEGKGAIWVSAPFVDGTGKGIAEKWWGDAPTYDSLPTREYVRALVKEVCAHWGGDPECVVLAGFSRGSIAVNRVGLEDDETAKLWRAFLCFSHYDGVQKWPYPEAGSVSAKVRLGRLGARPQFICGEYKNPEETREYLERTTEKAPQALRQFTFVSTGFRNHNDAWVLRPSPARDRLRAWWSMVIAGKR